MSNLPHSLSLNIIIFYIFSAEKKSNVLLKTEVSTVPIHKCKMDVLLKGKFSEAVKNGMDESKYCAAKDGNDSCEGDSGGPLQTSGNLVEVVGIVAFGQVCGKAIPGIYTRVANYTEWIVSHVWPHGKIQTPQKQAEEYASIQPSIYSYSSR